jgi:hypothetical protein
MNGGMVSIASAASTPSDMRVAGLEAEVMAVPLSSATVARAGKQYRFR